MARVDSQNARHHGRWQRLVPGIARAGFLIRHCWTRTRQKMVQRDTSRARSRPRQLAGGREGPNASMVYARLRLADTDSLTRAFRPTWAVLLRCIPLVRSNTGMGFPHLSHLSRRG